MKTIILFSLVAICTVVNASESKSAHDYKCISSRLEAYNSDIYLGLSSTEIDDILSHKEDPKYGTVAHFTEICDAEASRKIDCNGNLEAQFIGKIKNVSFSEGEAGNSEHTSYKIGDFSLYNVNSLCPLQQELAVEAVIYLPNYSPIANGDTVSGVLIYNPKFNQFSIE